MSGIDLTNPQVLRNFIKAQIKEGNGKFLKKDNVYIFRTFKGDQFIVPDDVEIPEEKSKKEPVEGAKEKKAKDKTK